MCGYTQAQLRLRGSGISIKDCAVMMGLSTATLSQKLAGKREFKVSEMWHFADIVGVDQCDIKDVFPPRGRRK